MTGNFKAICNLETIIRVPCPVRSKPNISQIAEENISSAMEEDEHSDARLRLVDFREVKSSMERARANWRDPEEFNTHGHTFEEINAVVSEYPYTRHKQPSPEPMKYSNWVDLLMKHQGGAEWHCFEIPRWMAQEIIDIQMIWFLRGCLRQDSVDDVIESFPARTTKGDFTSDVFSGRKRWFLRLDLCSSKDSVDGGLPVQSLADLLRQLCTSQRAAGALGQVMDEDKEHKPKLILVPFNNVMDPAREFRVFCPRRGLSVAAISQYRWHCPYPVKEYTQMLDTASRVLSGALRFHKLILRHAQALKNTTAYELMSADGFTFDILCTADYDVHLVEINGFGAMSGCGSCLFHWIRDARLLYGFEDRTEIRMTREMDSDELPAGVGKGLREF